MSFHVVSWADLRTCPPPQYSRTYVRHVLADEMRRLGITPARLRRCCWRQFRISRARVEQALAGDPGHLGTWTPAGLFDWLDMIRSAWLH